MGSQRMIRVNELLKRQISEDLYHLHNPPVKPGEITVTRVDTSADLRQARVYISVIQGEEKRQQAVDYLNKRHGELQRLVMKRVRLKYTPRFEFEADPTLEEGDRVLKLLEEMEESGGSSPPEKPDPFDLPDASDRGNS
ncbi:30S ribosome-binding factor RbfA [Kiritimatiella glycovorans]|uniref:Ribosome-binding factor A n=1 Tax=Kiritimatiella glycovorans TaxID=1307763 RepID=A0A0G3EA85_9BACT|nr:30S ribosome-binding factor RbfA [Kiritimatiella glycovorans]AKJ63351.1 Ribosome-binding factor A [Kiritimatiella glycovorans]